MCFYGLRANTGTKSVAKVCWKAILARGLYNMIKFVPLCKRFGHSWFKGYHVATNGQLLSAYEVRFAAKHFIAFYLGNLSVEK